MGSYGAIDTQNKVWHFNITIKKFAFISWKYKGLALRIAPDTEWRDSLCQVQTRFYETYGLNSCETTV